MYQFHKRKFIKTSSNISTSSVILDFLQKSDRPCLLWVLKLGLGKKSSIQCFFLFTIVLLTLKLFFPGW